MSVGMPPDLPGLTYIQPLGSGGYADVYLYQQEMPRMPVAVKVLKAEGLTEAIRRQFIDEADTMAQLADHPFIVQIFRTGTAEDGRPYLVMKYYPPPNLAARARAEQFTTEGALVTGIQLASAVETAHRAGIIHRDIKPANVLVSSYGAPGLTDFGIAGRGLALDDAEDDVGVSVPWAPPEVLFGQSNGDERADVYSLAATLWQLLVGRSPFEVPGGDNSAYALMPRIRSTAVPSTGRADVPASLERLLAQAMAKQPEARPATAIDFARALQTIEQEQRFARTQIVVLDEQGHTTVADRRVDPGGDDRTRVKAPQSVRGAQALDGSTGRRPSGGWGPPLPDGSKGVPAAPGAHGSSPAPTWAPGGASAGPTPAAGVPVSTASGDDALAEEGTVNVRRRPGSDGPPEHGVDDSSDAIKIGGGALLAGLLTLLLLVGGAVWAVTRSSDDPGEAAPPTTVGSPRTGPIIEVQGPPDLAAAPAKGEVVFSWTVPDLEGADRFTVRTAAGDERVEDAKAVSVKNARQHAVSAKKGTKVCAQVRLSRGGVLSPWSRSACDVAR